MPREVRLLKRDPTRGALVAAVHRPEELPELLLPVAAFVGRSNVGKSSLLNRLLGTVAARVSRTPGKTRGIYFYETSEGHYFADLPGSGFARVSQEERAGWAELAERFFRSGRVALAVHVIDPRVPDAPADLAMRDYLASLGVSLLPVATKWDRFSAAERVRARRRVEAIHGSVTPVSAKTGEGIETLRREIRLRLEKGGETAHG
jgi:GTP-binding protein